MLSRVSESKRVILLLLLSKLSFIEMLVYCEMFSRCLVDRVAEGEALFLLCIISVGTPS